MSVFDDHTALIKTLTTAFTNPVDSVWQLSVSGYQPALENNAETRSVVSNGFLGTRASLEQPTAESRARTYVAGLFDLPTSGVIMPVLVSGPDWMRFDLFVDDERLSFNTGETLAHSRLLDMRHGVLMHEWRRRSAQGKLVRVQTLRFASLADRALAIHLAVIEVDRPATLMLDVEMNNDAVHLQLMRITSELSLWRTTHSERFMAMARDVSMQNNGVALHIEPSSVEEAHQWRWQAQPGQSAMLGRLIAVARGENEEEVSKQAWAALQRAQLQTSVALFDAHLRAWESRWEASDVLISGDDHAQFATRFAIYHLISTANPVDPRVSISARALTGDDYRGHVFWDTEIFLLPFYIVTWPEAAHALLMYRFHTLPAARAKAERLGYRGAFYAWESTDTGDESTPRGVIGLDGKEIVFKVATDELHISADIAYAIWQYWLATGDESFLLDAGAEIIFETARFWSSAARLEDDGYYHIRGVIGPDEYHEDVDDNAYTNVMAQWNIEAALKIVDLLQARWPDRWLTLQTKLQLNAAELATWQAVAVRILTGFDPQTGLFEQFAGYYGLEEIDLAQYTWRTKPMDVVLGRERTQQSKVIKQADVVMLIALHWDRFHAEVRAANFHYYEPRTGHGSSLSPAMYAQVAARLGHVELAARLFDQAVAIDLDDTMGNVGGGIHIATLGGLWQAAVLGFGGVRLVEDGVHIDPHLPPDWNALHFRVQWRGCQALIEIQREPSILTATLERGESMPIVAGGVAHTLVVGRQLMCDLDG
jgi:trehalose/maltose hydrolase-like predicted phosphorylase